MGLSALHRKNIFFSFRYEKFKLLKPETVTAETLHYVEQGVKETEQAFLSIQKSTSTGKKIY